MSEHTATIRWAQTGGDFFKGRYSRAHTWTFDGGATVPASASSAWVPKAFTDEASVDPEEAFVASIASCHMLTFLFLAMKAGFEVASYEDTAVGTMTRNERGVPWISSVVLAPAVVYHGGKRPSADEEAQLHHAAHDQCFISNSIRTAVTVSARAVSAAPAPQ